MFKVKKYQEKSTNYYSKQQNLFRNNDGAYISPKMSNKKTLLSVKAIWLSGLFTQSLEQMLLIIFF